MEQSNIFLDIMKTLPDFTKLGQENIELKKQNKNMLDQIQNLLSEIQTLKKKNSFLLEQHQQDKAKISKQKNKIKELKKKNARKMLPSSHRIPQSISSSIIGVDDTVFSTPSPETPISQSCEEHQFWDNDFDEIDRLLSEIDTSEVSKLKSPKKTIRKAQNTSKEKNFAIQQDSSLPNEKKIENSPKISQKTTRSTKKTAKKENVLPKPYIIPDLLKEIRESEVSHFDFIISRILAAQFTTILSMKKYYSEILNTIGVSIRTLDEKSPDLQNYISFFIKFAKRISPQSLENLKKSVASKHELESMISAIEDTIDLLEC
ncbi:hypothetical protein TRFO_11192 [Tritrichomonas foetus]|uniref:Uncharacterized protein n=1 Tax=Tritrichomonas foetus TaxID=1144522 RepID=A0A1J4J7X1_9EUKA|nr:hypothetical protein TRFO_11192 [Tritrichomonas foetus]|eukprot:OHS94335.1 hypothetical protein TRFO_11192 [Tritrichomonas foetus]